MDCRVLPQSYSATIRDPSGRLGVGVGRSAPSSPLWEGFCSPSRDSNAFTSSQYRFDRSYLCAVGETVSSLSTLQAATWSRYKSVARALA